MAKKLTAKEENFALTFVRCNNGSEAYRQSYDTKTDNAETVHQAASRILAKSHVAARIQQLRQKIARRVEVSLERTLFENARIAFSDIRRLFDSEGNLLPMTEWDDDMAAAVASIKVRTERRDQEDAESVTTTEIKLWPKNPAIEQLMRHFGAFEKDNKQTASILEALGPDVLRLLEQKLLTQQQKLLTLGATK